MLCDKRETCVGASTSRTHNTKQVDHRPKSMHSHFPHMLARPHFKKMEGYQVYICPNGHILGANAQNKGLCFA